jgi:tetratricopeptide (TPR) repeat protein
VRATAPVFLTAATLLCTVLTVRAIPHWRSNESLRSYSLEQSPDAVLLHIEQGELLQFRQGDLEGAAKEFETALQLNAASLRPLPAVDYSAYLGLGLIARRKGRRDEALSYFQKAARLMPQRSPAYDLLGTVYFPRREYAKAAEYFAQAVRVDAYDLQARFYLGTCWFKLGKYRQAAEQFRAARQVDPTYWQAYEAEARALEAAGDAAGAAQIRRLSPGRE